MRDYDKKDLTNIYWNMHQYGNIKNLNTKFKFCSSSIIFKIWPIIGKKFHLWRKTLNTVCLNFKSDGIS